MGSDGSGSDCNMSFEAAEYETKWRSDSWFFGELGKEMMGRRMVKDNEDDDKTWQEKCGDRRC